MGYLKQVGPPYPYLRRTAPRYRRAPLNFRGGNLTAELDALAEGVAFPLGHNPIVFDLPHPAATKPDLRLMRLRRNWFFVSALCYKLLL